MNISFNYQIDIAPQETQWLLDLELTCTLAEDDFTIDAFDVVGVNVLNDSTKIFDAVPIIDETFCLTAKSHLCEEIRDDLERFKNDIYNEAVEAYNEQRIA